jgi:hypothetical protein
MVVKIRDSDRHRRQPLGCANVLSPERLLCGPTTTPQVLVAFPPKCDSGESPMTISRSVVQPTSRRFRGRRGRPGILSTAGIERRFDVWRRVGLTATWPAFMKTVECDRSGWLVVLCGCLIRGDRRGLGNRCSIHRATGLVGSALGAARTPSTFGRAAVGPRCPR